MLTSLLCGKISQTVSVALEYGMHTEMKSSFLDDGYVWRCRRLWWTIYILERQMSALMGVPMAVADELISAPCHTYPGDAQSTNALQIQVQLSRVLSRIHHSRFPPYDLPGPLY